MSLRRYRQKRRFEATPEPTGGGRTRRRAPIFVVQLHHASHRHYDFRLQVHDVLKSWAVPKGPSFDPSVKRLAMEVEDHPLEYARFEGIIPPGNYGAGDVLIFDHGTWSTDGDVDAQLQKGHLRFTLFGDKLRGAWDLIRTGGRGGPRPQWLLRKTGDDEAGPFEADDLLGDPEAQRRPTRIWHSNRGGGGDGGELAVVGYTEPRGLRSGIGALVMGRPLPNGRWAYAGRVGAGMDDGVVRKLALALRPLERPRPTVVAASLRAARAAGDLRHVHWIEPQLAVELAPRRERAGAPRSSEPPPQEPGPRPRVTHGERVVYPQVGLTKADVFAYYRAIAPFILPEIARRPLAIVRCTDGIEGGCFFQKHMKPGFGPHVRGVRLPSSSGKREAHLMIEDVAGLLALAQMSTIEIHPWGTHADDADRADRLVFDLDPAEDVAWPRVVDAARRVRKALLAVGLESFVRTSGAKGLHVVAPLRPSAPWDRVRAFARRIAEGLAADHPEELVATMAKRHRAGRIFVDHFRNARGATAIASYSLRRTPEATVAMPLAWSDLGRIVGPKDFDLRKTLRALARRRHDPWQGIDELEQPLPP